MVIQRIGPRVIHAIKVAELGLDPGALDLESVEAISCAIRRAALYKCPCSEASLIAEILGPLEGLVSNNAEARRLVEGTIESLVAHGDLQELAGVGLIGEENSQFLLYGSPPSFVARESGAIILLGVGTESALSEELRRHIQHFNHVRRLPAVSNDLKTELRQLGLLELSHESWLKTPQAHSATELLDKFDALLTVAAAAGEVPGLSILDPDMPNRFYKGRWVQPRAHTGRFVGRREQRYGAPLWCYIEIKDGAAERLVDLPLKGSKWRGCDDAWYLQAAIDASRSKPQSFRARELTTKEAVFEFYSPLPMWARRRLDALAEPIPAAGCLFAYRVPKNEVAQECEFLERRLFTRPNS